MILNNYKMLLYAMAAMDPNGNTSKFSSDSNFFNNNIRIIYTDSTYSSSSDYQKLNLLGYGDSSNPVWRNIINPNAYAKWIHWTGSGDTPVQPTDYTLEQVNNDSFSSRNAAFSITLDENYNKIITATMTGINNTNSTQTIKEFGILVPTKTGSATNYEHRILLVREVLDTPLVIEPGAGYRIVAEIVENVT